MGAVPLVRSAWDPRLAAAAALYALLLALAVKAVMVAEEEEEEKEDCNKERSRLALALLFLVLPFLPVRKLKKLIFKQHKKICPRYQASNLVFSVGFVVAERVLYTPR